MRSGIQSLANAIMLAICLVMIAALILPSIVRQRADAREQTCSNNMKQLGLALHNYHAAYKQLPPGAGGTTGGDTPESSNAGRLGMLVAVLPFVEQQALWEQIVNPYTNPATGQRFPLMGPVPWYDPEAYEPWNRAPWNYLCPAGRPEDKGNQAQKIVYTLKSSDAAVLTNYVACYGDGTFNNGQPWGDDRDAIQQSRASKRGIFASGHAFKFRDVLDGLSNTIMMSETRASSEGDKGTAGIAKDVEDISLNPSLCLRAAEDTNTKWWDFGRGSRWCDGALPITGFQTVLPPNSGTCTSENGLLDAIASASSDHADGAMVLFADGAVVFMTNGVDCGDSTAPGVAIGEGYAMPGSKSPYGLWGALGTRASMETINNQGREATRGINAALGFDRRFFRTWHDKTGRIALLAEFVQIIDEKTIELKDGAGVLHRVPLNTLKAADIYKAVAMDRAAE